MFVLIAGGGKIGLHLVRTLLNRGHEVALIEKDQRVCAMVVEEFESVIVLAGDATNPEMLQRADVARADVVVAAVGRDQDNYILCKMAKHLYGVKRAVARVNDPRNEELFRLAGVDYMISVTSMVSRAIEHEIAPQTIQTLFNWHGRMSMIEAHVTTDSPVVGRPLRDVTFPPGSILAAIWREGSALIPSGETVLETGDEIFAITLQGKEDELCGTLAG